MWVDRLVTLMSGYRRATPGLEDFRRLSAQELPGFSAEGDALSRWRAHERGMQLARSAMPPGQPDEPPETTDAHAVW
jgi:hypothetical protein